MYLYGKVVVLVQVVRHSKVDPVVSIPGLEYQNLVPGIYESADVPDLDLQELEEGNYYMMDIAGEFGALHLPFVGCSTDTF